MFCLVQEWRSLLFLINGHIAWFGRWGLLICILCMVLIVKSRCIMVGGMCMGVAIIIWYYPG